MMLLREEGVDAVYDVFGIMFIESDPGGMLTGIVEGDRGRGALERIVQDPRSKELKAVIGASLGAVTVADYFADNPKLTIPFFLDSPPGDIKGGVSVCIFGRCLGASVNVIDYNEAAEGHQAFAGMFGFWSCPNRIHHCVNSHRAGEAFDLIADKARSLGR